MPTTQTTPTTPDFAMLRAKLYDAGAHMRSLIEHRYAMERDYGKGYRDAEHEALIQDAAAQAADASVKAERQYGGARPNCIAYHARAAARARDLAIKLRNGTAVA